MSGREVWIKGSALFDTHPAGPNTAAARDGRLRGSHTAEWSSEGTSLPLVSWITCFTGADPGGGRWGGRPPLGLRFTIEDIPGCPPLGEILYPPLLQPRLVPQAPIINGVFTMMPERCLRLLTTSRLEPLDVGTLRSPVTQINALLNL